MHQQQFYKVSVFFLFLVDVDELGIERIYICGGFNGQECMNSAEYFDPKINQWTIIAPMRHRRSGIGIIAYHNCIYALFVTRTVVSMINSSSPRGGFNGSTRMNSVERYNPKTNTWMSISDMYNPRSNFAIEVNSYLSFPLEFLSVHKDR